MKRREFITTSVLVSTAFATLPVRSMLSLSNPYSRDLLIGKGSPELLGENYKMEKATHAAFQLMKAAAVKEGINIELVSAYRSFQRQKEIYEGKYKRFTGRGLTPMAAIEKIIEYSTIPGTSRHHWGTDIDIIDNVANKPKDVLLAKHFHGKGPFCKLKDWLDQNADTFGFYEVYTDNANRKGFNYEPWHFSYAPVCKPMLDAYKKLDIKQILLEEKLLGAEYFTDDFIAKYRAENILDINPKLL